MTRTSLILLLLAAAGGVIGFPQQPSNLKQCEDLAVVVNSKNAAHDLSMSELRNIVVGQRKFWKNRVPITVVVREPGTREYDALITKVLRMDDNSFRALWSGKKFRGEVGAEPLVVSSENMAMQYVLSSPGAISFVTAKDVVPDVKILMIDGKWPGQTGYPLR